MNASESAVTAFKTLGIPNVKSLVASKTPFNIEATVPFTVPKVAFLYSASFFASSCSLLRTIFCAFFLASIYCPDILSYSLLASNPFCAFSNRAKLSLSKPSSFVSLDFFIFNRASLSISRLASELATFSERLEFSKEVKISFLPSCEFTIAFLLVSEPINCSFPPSTYHHCANSFAYCGLFFIWSKNNFSCSQYVLLNVSPLLSFCVLLTLESISTALEKSFNIFAPAIVSCSSVKGFSCFSAFWYSVL